MSNGFPIVSVKFWNFRSVAEPVVIPLQEKLILLVGQNNSGKSSILRFLALLLNKAWSALDELHDVPVGQSLPVHFQIELDKEFLFNQLGQRDSLKQMLASRSWAGSTYFNGSFRKEEFKWDFDETFFELVPENYFFAQNFRKDHSNSSSSVDDNIRQFKNSLNGWLDHLKGTVYVPSLRFISTNAVSHFAQRPFPGSTVAFSIIDAISQLSEPHRDCRRPIYLSYAAIGKLSMAA